MRSVWHTSFLALILFYAAYAKEEALIFDPEDGSIFIPPTDNSEYVNTGERAIACPAETQAENDFIRKYSFTKNALFVKEINLKNTEVSKMKINICEKPYEISLAYKIENSTFQFGHEIYYNLKQKFHFDQYTSNYEDYASTVQVIESTKTIFSQGIYYAKQYFRIILQAIKNAVGLGHKKLLLNEDKMGLVWLYLFKLRFNLTKKILEMTWHEIQANNKWTTQENCKDYSLGFEAYDGTHVDDLYNNQAEIFENFELPSNACESINQCLMKWSLIPLDQFRFDSSTSLLCSNITTIPIWKGKTEKILQKVDKYLYTLFRVLNEPNDAHEPIHVLSGITGEHRFSNKGSSKKSILYLDSKKKKIPVPNLIYKIVEYRLKNCRRQEDYCWYSAIIVIHNNLFFKPADKICTKDVTEEWGWEEITKDSDGNKWDEIYVCDNTKSVQKKLKMEVTEKVAGGLNLIQFKYSKDGWNVDVKYIKEFVDGKFKKFSEEGENYDPVNSKMVKRVPPRSNASDDLEVVDHEISKNMEASGGR